MTSPAYLVTGGAGFIGANFVHFALRETDARVIVLDKLTYAGHRESLEDVQKDPRFDFVHGDITDRALVSRLLREKQITALVNFAAESHVDRSIEGPSGFLETNVRGTFELLEAVRAYLKELEPRSAERFRFLHVSTDEVYGSLGAEGVFQENTPYAPNSPYAASKAAADHWVRAYYHTYELPVLITNCSNNYGPYQFPEKLIPLMTLNAVEGKPLPIYGDGGNVRDWLFVEDHCRGIQLALEKGRLGEKYNLGGGAERNNLQVVDRICAVLETLRPGEQNANLRKAAATHYADLKRFVKDRPGHDRRYAIDATKAREELGWSPSLDFDAGIQKTIEWYLSHAAWCEKVQANTYNRERLGLL